MADSAASPAQFPGSPSTPVRVLHPGDVALAFEGERLSTLLGSCVSVILTDPRRTVAAMCHIVHSGAPGLSSRGDTAFAVYAMQEMFTQLRTIGITPQLCHAFVFGGGNMFPGLIHRQHVGASNVAWVDNFLRAHGIELVDASTGGEGYRKICWTVGVDPMVVEYAGSAINGEQHKGF